MNSILRYLDAREKLRIARMLLADLSRFRPMMVASEQRKYRRLIRFTLRLERLCRHRKPFARGKGDGVKGWLVSESDKRMKVVR